jgi:hypothetical protein
MKSFALFLLLFGLMAKADEERPFHVSAPSGRVYTDQYFYTQNPNRSLAQSSVSFWLGSDFTLPAHETSAATYGGKALGQLDLFDRSLERPNGVSSHFQVREAYVSYSAQGIDVRVGQQIIPWGKSDGINPTDYFTAKNYTLLNPDEEVRRIGAPALNVQFTPGDGASPFNFQAVGQAYYPQAKLIIPDQVIPTGVNFVKDPASPSAFHSNTMEYGFKVSYLKPSYDFSLSYFHGFSQFPEYELQTATSQISPINPQVNAVGGDGSFTFGSYVFRFESALLMPENGGTGDPLYGLVEPNHWDTVVGAERTFAEDFHVQVQATLRYHLNYKSPNDYTATNSALPPLVQAQQVLLQQGIGRANAILLNYQNRTNPGATLRFGYASDTSDWTGDLLLVGYFAGGQDFIFTPELGYKIFEGAKLTTGAQFYGGNANTPFGALKDQSVVFFDGRYLF